MINLVEKIKSIKILDQFDLDNKKLMLIVLISVVVFYIDFNFILKAQVRWLAKSGTKVERFKKDLDNFKIDLKKMRDLESKQTLASQKPVSNAKSIIPANQFSSLLQDISRTANHNDVRILQIKPSRMPTENQSNKAKVPVNLNPFMVNLDLSCAYHNLGKFINELENLQAFVSLRDIKIEPQDDNYLKQKVNLALVTYVKK
ncbi:MAG: type 4a pilus biogenesis protein PilO [Candidatus Omnitrophota bacterium]|nr:type 4a pilus biogenesis protein PilO [Candidatus Omnitrophota bacterium]